MRELRTRRRHEDSVSPCLRRQVYDEGHSSCAAEDDVQRHPLGNAPIVFVGPAKPVGFTESLAPSRTRSFCWKSRTVTGGGPGLPGAGGPPAAGMSKPLPNPSRNA